MSAVPQILGHGLPPALLALVERHQHHREKTTADRSLAQRLREAIEQSGIEVKGLAFYVHDGVISIYGSVRDTTVREALLHVTTRLPGVRRIVDHLHIGDA